MICNTSRASRARRVATFKHHGNVSLKSYQNDIAILFVMA